jgi:hypothetical protein
MIDALDVVRKTLASTDGNVIIDVGNLWRIAGCHGAIDDEVM